MRHDDDEDALGGVVALAECITLQHRREEATVLPADDFWPAIFSHMLKSTAVCGIGDA